jgi:hypothetical protein
MVSLNLPSRRRLFSMVALQPKRVWRVTCWLVMETLMFMDSIDYVRLRNDLANLADEAKHVKRLLGSTWLRPMADEQRRRARIRRRATELHVLLAHSRGHIHVSTPPRNASPDPAWDCATWHARIAGLVAPDYAFIVRAAAL